MLDKIAEKFPLYVVGGACRDEILGVKPNDYDFVCVATKEEFELEFGDVKCVGDSFPVYLVEGKEVALSRNEKSTGSGYHDFTYESGVSIEDDLFRRDASMNSIAKCYTTGKLIDLYDGIRDIKNKIVRMIDPYTFYNDPLRILRMVRQSIQFGFDIEERTKIAMKQSVHLLNTITAERIQLELQKMYKNSEKPSQFFDLLYEIGGLGIHFKPFYVAKNVTAGRVEFHHGNSVYQHLMNSLDTSKRKGYSFSVAMAGAMHDFGKIITPKEILPKHILHEHRGEKLHKVFLSQHRFDAYTQGLIILTGRMHMRMHLLEQMRPTKIVKFLNSIPKKYFDDFIKACDTDKELEPEKLFIIECFKDVKRDTKIEIPTTIKNNGDAIKNFVHEVYTKALTGKIKALVKIDSMLDISQ